MSKIDQVVFLIESGKIVESKIRDLDGFVDETTTPQGIAPRFHVRENQLWTWGYAGNNPRMVREFDTEAEAVEAMEDHFATDFFNSDILSFTTRADAEAFLRQAAGND